MRAVVGFQQVAVEGLVKMYGPTRALTGATGRFEAGEVTVLEGPNGSGKSTLLAVLAQLARPTRGTVRYGDQVIRGSRGTATAGAIATSAEVAQAEALRARIGLLGHAALLYPDLTPRENLGLFAKLYRVDAPSRAVDEALDRFDLGGFADRPARTLSRGQLQRAALARALVHRPDLLLLDEPSTGLDPRSNDRLVGEVEVERARGAVIVLVTHDPALAERVATRRLRMHRGRLLSAAEAPG